MFWCRKWRCSVLRIVQLTLPVKKSAAIFAARLRIARGATPGGVGSHTESGFQPDHGIAFPARKSIQSSRQRRGAQTRHPLTRESHARLFSDVPPKTRHCLGSLGGSQFDRPAACGVSIRGFYSNLSDVTFNVSPCTSPLTSTRKCAFLSD